MRRVEDVQVQVQVRSQFYRDDLYRLPVAVKVLIDQVQGIGDGVFVLLVYGQNETDD